MLEAIAGLIWATAPALPHAPVRTPRRLPYPVAIPIMYPASPRHVPRRSPSRTPQVSVTYPAGSRHAGRRSPPRLRGTLPALALPAGRQCRRAGPEPASASTGQPKERRYYGFLLTVQGPGTVALFGINAHCCTLWPVIAHSQAFHLGTPPHIKRLHL